MENKNPLVSVVIPVYNSEKYLEECLQTVVNQTYKNIEIIIVNDGSTDKSREIINEYLNKYKNISVIDNKKSSGCGESASNCGIKISKGVYVGVLDSDDLSFPDRFEKEVAFLEKRKDYFMVSACAETIDKNGYKKGIFGKGMTYNQILRKIYLSNPVINSSILFRRSELCGDFYKIKWVFSNDYYTWLYYLSIGKKIKIIPDLLVKYRIHDSNISFKNLKNNFLTTFLIKKNFSKNKFLKISYINKCIVYFEELILKLLPERILIFVSFLNRKRLGF